MYVGTYNIQLTNWCTAFHDKMKTINKAFIGGVLLNRPGVCCPVGSPGDNDGERLLQAGL